MYTQEVKIKKSDIKAACLTVPRTKLVTGSLVIGGVTHEANTLEFVGFRGVKVEPGIWGGHFHFKDKGVPSAKETITPAQLDAFTVTASVTKPATPRTGGNKKK